MKRIVATIGLMVLAATSVSAEEITWRKTIKGVVEQHCLACHGADSAPEYTAFKEQKEEWIAKGQGMRMDTYSHLIFYTAWADTGSLMRRLDDGKNTKEGKPGNMYQHLGATEEERQKNLAAFKGWVGNWSLKRWAEVTKDELNGIKVKY